ncbi:MAG TPA: 50S ribosomal protein L15 [Candidatus Limnocylindrales bacterium]|jgi:large subunit ribosomal protein L15|nr:50S ribosomal protein L15 [Candidatus Limnocylindrales bacterium]
MKLHDLRPADGSRKARTRVGRGIAAGKGKTAGRGTKGQKARAGGSIPAWFEGGQTPLHMRIPKLRGFTNRLKVDYEVVNIGAIGELVELGRLEPGEMPGATSKAKAAAPITVNQDILRAAGLVRTLQKPLKILGGGELSTALFVVADRFTKSAIVKIEAAGGSVSMLEVPKERRPAIGVERGSGGATDEKPASKKPSAESKASAGAAQPTEPAAAAEAVAEAPAAVAEAPVADGRASETSGASETDAPSAEAPRASKPKRSPKAARPAADASTGDDDASPAHDSASPADEAAPAGDG